MKHWNRTKEPVLRICIVKAERLETVGNKNGDKSHPHSGCLSLSASAFKAINNTCLVSKQWKQACE